MSTKSTIVHGPTFRLYTELFDDEYVYLDIKDIPFEITPQSVMIGIPLHIWEVIRAYPGSDLTFADMDDDQVFAYVTEEVDKRIARYQEAAERAKPMVAMFGVLPYGGADTPREQQIEAGMSYFTNVRNQQRQIKQAITELQRMNQPPQRE